MGVKRVLCSEKPTRYMPEKEERTGGSAGKKCRSSVLENENLQLWVPRGALIQK